MNAFSIQRIKYTGPLALAIVFMPFSVLLCHLGLLIFAIVWLAEGDWEGKWETIRKNPVVFIFIFFFLLHAAGVIYSSDQQNAWFNLEKKFSLAILPLMLVSIKLERDDARKLFHIFVITCVVASLICLVLAINKALLSSSSFIFDSYNAATYYANTTTSNIWTYFSYTELASGIGIHPTFFSLYLVFCVFLLIHFYAESFASFAFGKKVLLLALLIYLSVFVLFLSSRIMIFALLIVSFYGLKLFLKTASFTTQWITSFITIMLFFCFIYVNPVSRFRNFQEIVSTWPYVKPGFQRESTTIRASLWSLSIKSVPKINWLIGTGTGDVEHLIAETGKTANVTNVMGSNDPHNQYLQTLLGLGILGLVTLIICFAWPTLLAYQTGNFLYLGFIFLIVILCVTETAIERQKGIVFYSLFNSLILFQFNPVKSESMKMTIA